MTYSSVPIRWTDPATWPWVVWVWLAFILFGWIVSLWRWLQCRRASGWPIADGRIDSVEVRKPNFSLTTKRGYYVSELSYSYPLAGTVYAGRHKRDIASEWEANEFVRDLQGKPVAVHYNPNNPSTSSLLESDVEAVLQSRGPAAFPSPSLSTPPVAESLRPFLRGFVALSAIGLVVSVWVHVGAIMGHSVPAFFWALHVGIFVVWFPTVLVAQRLTKSAGGKNSWKVIMRGSPAWMRYMTYFFFAYAFVNFFLFMQQLPSGSSANDPPASVWRGFSGHWMLFYSAALAVLYSAARVVDASPRCVNGHLASPSAMYCTRCGQPVMRGSATSG
jgi:hypothetical protein